MFFLENWTCDRWDFTLGLATVLVVPPCVAATVPPWRCSRFFPTCHQQDWRRLGGRIPKPGHLETKVVLFSRSMKDKIA